MRRDSCIDAFDMTMIYIIILFLPMHCWKPKRNARENAHDNINNILAAIARSKKDIGPSRFSWIASTVFRKTSFAVVSAWATVPLTVESTD